MYVCMYVSQHIGDKLYALSATLDLGGGVKTETFYGLLQCKPTRHMAAWKVEGLSCLLKARGTQVALNSTESSTEIQQI